MQAKWLQGSTFALVSLWPGFRINCLLAVPWLRHLTVLNLDSILGDFQGLALPEKEQNILKGYSLFFFSEDEALPTKPLLISPGWSVMHFCLGTYSSTLIISLARLPRWTKMFLHFFLTTPRGMWELTSPARGRTLTLCIGRTETFFL